MTRLPLALAPLDNESWPSYLTRRAAQHGTNLAELGTHLGLRDGRGRWPGRFGVELAAGDVHRIAPILGLAPVEVEGMQLASYDQLAFDLIGLHANHAIAATRAAVHAGWVWLAGSTFCPHCLADDDGAWRLSWRIPWNTVCLRHNAHLVGACQVCEGVPGLGNRLHGSAPPRVSAAPDGRRCPHPEPDGVVCGADLGAQATTTAGGDRLRRAKNMRDLTAGNGGRVLGIERTSLQALRAWQSAIGIGIHLGVADAGGWGRRHRWANPPRDPDVIDRLLAGVEPLVTAPDPATGAAVLENWLKGAGIHSPHANTFIRITQPCAALQPAIDAVLQQHGRAHTVIQRHLVAPSGGPIAERAWGVDDIPQLVWPCALPEHLRESTRPDQRILRAVVSMILVRMCTGATDWPEAGAALGFPPDKSRNWTRYAFSGRWSLKPELIAAADNLASHKEFPREQRYQRRGEVRGFGVGALSRAQAPRCTRAGGAWCPCLRRWDQDDF